MRSKSASASCVVLLVAVAMATAPLRPVLAQTDEEAYREAHAANVDVEVYQRIVPVGEKAEIRAWLYNTKKATFKAYRVPLEDLAPNAYAVYESDEDEKGSLPYRLKRLDVRGIPVAAKWTLQLKEIYEDSWESRDLKVPKLKPGVYVITMTGGGVEDRTWLAASNRALLSKRSPDVVLGWLVNANTGQPVAGSWVHLYDRNGRVAAKQTERDGTVQFPAPTEGDICWMAATGGDPAFVMPSAPRGVDPYEAFVYTDRPIYRPGHLVRFRGTVRRVERGQYSVPDQVKTVQVEIKTGGDPVYRKDLDLNEWGSFAADFQLAPEPPLGTYELVTTVGEGKMRTRFYKSFEVEAYRKPEFEPKVTIPEEHYLQGAAIPVTISADYFFGSPVAGGKVEYEVSFSSYGRAVPQRIRDAAGLGTTEAMRMEDDFWGEGRLDEEGKLVLEVPTRYATMDRTMRVEATVSELALRPRTASASTLITAASFRLSVSTDQWEYYMGDTVPVTVTTRDYDDNPVSVGVKVTIIETKQDREGRYYEERTDYQTETNDEGVAKLSFKPERPNGYAVEAWAKDEEGNPVYDSDAFRVEKERPEKEWPALSLAADKDSYVPGETAMIHTKTDLRGSWVLLTIEGERLFDAVVHRLQSNEFVLGFRVLEEYKPNVRVDATVVKKGDRTSDYATLNVPHTEKQLKIVIAPDKEVYAPGEKATYSIVTRDHADAGVAAEVGLGVVDESLYAIREDDTPDPFGIFWGWRRPRVTSDFSHARLYPGGGAQAYPLAAAPPRDAEKMAEEAEGLDGAEEEIRVRRRFLDTAFWAPFVVTGPDGSAQVEFEMPDNLTTWRATARGLTSDTAAGDATQEVTVTMPLLVRLALPRFYVAEDEGTAAAIVHNYTGEEKTVKVALTAKGMEVQGDPEQTIKLAPDGIKRLTWKVTAVGPDEGVFLVSADGGPGAQDAMEARLPVIPSGVKNVAAYAGSTDGNVEQSIPLSEDALAGTAELTITLSPSLAGPIFEALDYLTRYPYGCAEQTMDSFLPDVIVARTLEKLGAKRPRPKMLDRYVNFGLQKLLRYQHDDGGWHWWEFDDSDPYISAYIVYGLKIADEAGYVTARAPMLRGVSYLVGALQEEDFRQAQAYLLWALAYANAWDKDAWDAAIEVAADLEENREKLDVFSRASLGLAVHYLSRSVKEEDRERIAALAREMAHELDALAIKEGIGAHWTPEGQARYSWLNNDVEVTCQVLRLLLAATPDSENIQPAIRWLMSMRRGKSWRSTKDTAAAVLALTAYLEQSEELSPEYSLKVLVGDKQVGEATMTEDDIFADAEVITVSAADLSAGDNVLKILKDGPGVVYWAARLSYLIPAAKAVPTTGDIVVKRTYRVPAENPVEADTQQPGEVVQVTLNLIAGEDLHYALLEEPIPAGCQIISGEDEPWYEIWDRRENWDNRIIWYFDYLPKGLHEVSYILRTEAPGQYNILPSTASLMYFPEVRGHNKLVRMRVADVQE